jgi:hypothetical protein
MPLVEVTSDGTFERCCIICILTSRVVAAGLRWRDDLYGVEMHEILPSS